MPVTLNVVVEWLKKLLIRKVLGLYLGLEAGYRDFGDFLQAFQAHSS
jgi:hypothetical protein